MRTIKEFIELAWILVIAAIVGAGGLVFMVLAIAAPFAAIGLGLAAAVKIFMWALGWSA